MDSQISIFLIFFILVCVFPPIVAAIDHRKRSPKPKKEKRTPRSSPPPPVDVRTLSTVDVKHDDRGKASHSGCEHEEKVAEDTLPATYRMAWDEFRCYVAALYRMDYPSVTYPGYRYRGSPELIVNMSGKTINLHILFVKQDVVVDDSSFQEEIKDCHPASGRDEVIVTNGRFTLGQRTSASQKKVTLTDGNDLAVLMRRYHTYGHKEK